MDEKYTMAQAVPYAILGGAGLLGRLTYHAKQVQAGKRKPLSVALLWDIPVALTMGWIALGIGIFFKVPREVTVSIGLAIAYLGPYTIDIAFSKWADRKGIPNANAAD